MVMRSLGIGGLLLLALGSCTIPLLGFAARARADAPKQEKPADQADADDQKEDAKEPDPALRALERKLPKLRLDRTPFHEAIGELAKACKTTFHIDRIGLEEAGAKLDTPVSIAPAEGQTGESVLKNILKQANAAGEAKRAMGYGAWGDVVVVSTDVQITLSRQGMDRLLPEVTFAGNGLAEVLDFVQVVTGKRIMIDWARLKSIGVKRDSGVTVKLTNAPVGEALRTILDAVSPKEPLAFFPDRGKVIVTRRGAVEDSLKDPKSLLPPDAPIDTGEGSDGL